MKLRRSRLLILPSIILLWISTPVSAQNGANSGSDAPDQVINAIPVNLDTIYSGELGDTFLNQDGDADNHDTYKVEPSTSGNLSVYFSVTSISSSLTSVTILRNGLVAGIEILFEDETPFRLVVPVPSGAV